MSLGMGLPLIAVGTGAGKFMPKPGGWMVMVNAIFGILMLGVAIWMLDKIFSPYIMMLLWSFLGLGVGLYFGAFDKEGHIFKRTVGIIIFIYSVALFIGALSGSSSYTKPLSFLSSKNNSIEAQKKELNFITVTSIEELNKVLSKNKGKKILIDFWAKWCTSCKELEEITFKDKRVQDYLKDYVLIRADITQNTKKQKELSKKYGVFGPPVLLFISKDAKLLKEKTIVGFLPPEEFIEKL
jgi:thiol:disulfide interchange protein DsbD